MRNLPEKGNNAVEEGTDWSIVIQRDQGVHLVLSSIQQGLHQVDSDSLEKDTSKLVQETNQDEIDLTERCNDDTQNDEGDVEQLHEVDTLDPKHPTSEENSNRGCGLFTC